MMQSVKIAFSVFNVETRRIVRTMNASTVHLIEVQCGPDEGWVFGHWDRHNHYVDENGEVVAGQPKPLALAAPLK